MKTLEQIKREYRSETWDRRDLYRLAQFIPADELADFGLQLEDGAEHSPIAFTRENVLEQLRKDVEFGFEKALDQRGLSADMMFDVVMMWNWILEEGLENFPTKRYRYYGLPLFKATANLYGFPDEIDGFEGDDPKFGYSYSYGE